MIDISYVVIHLPDEIACFVELAQEREAIEAVGMQRDVINRRIHRGKPEVFVGGCSIRRGVVYVRFDKVLQDSAA